MILESPLIAALNHLLDAEPWARARLAPFAGSTLELRAPPFPALRFRVAPEGRLGAAEEGAAPALILGIGPEALAAAARGEEHFMRSIEVAGDEDFAQAVLSLVRHLRWDAEEDLSQLVGDAAAHRLVRLAKEFAAWQADAARRIGEGLMEYAVEERRLLVPRAELEALAAANARLRDDLERLEKRLGRLTDER
jgi:ubiquinone biosynthesis protein UbiJ